MSNVNIRRAIENIRANTTVYTPIVEVIVNAIQAIEGLSSVEGKISIRVQRSEQREMDNSMPEVHSFEIEDNGIGFTDENRNSFDTLYTDLKINEGGKGFGRFTCLKGPLQNATFALKLYVPRSPYKSYGSLRYAVLVQISSFFRMSPIL